MVLATVLIIVGFFLLVKGADWMVSGASSLAKKLHVSDLVIGLTIVALGTSAPELVVNSLASFQNHADIVFGNIIGSNNFNTFVVLGIVGAIWPITVQKSTAFKEIPLSFLAIVIFYILANTSFFHEEDTLSRLDGFILFASFLLFLGYVYTQMKNATSEEIFEDTEIYDSNKKIWGYIVLGIVGLMLGGKIVVDNAVFVAEALGISKKVIGLTVVAVGTSLPELVTSVVAAFKKNSDIAIGNVIGSNVFNILLILAVSSLIKPLPYVHTFNTDVYVMAGGTVFVFLAMFIGKKYKLSRVESFILLTSFTSYTIYLILNEV